MMEETILNSSSSIRKIAAYSSKGHSSTCPNSYCHPDGSAYITPGGLGSKKLLKAMSMQTTSLLSDPS